LNKPIIKIHTDGAAKGNPGPGGLGVVLQFGPHRKTYSEGFRKTTNNRMELLAVIRALEMLKTAEHSIVIYSDSKYVVDAIEKGWVFNWASKGFAKKKNPDLWKKYLELHKIYKPKFVWVKGHADNPDNNLCDQLAVQASSQPNLPIDKYYEEVASKEVDGLF
jgi:ribonuclease HI